MVKNYGCHFGTITPYIGLSQLKKDKDRVVLTGDKGVAMVVMDKEDYIKKAESLLAQPAYRTIDRDLCKPNKSKNSSTSLEK